MLHTTRLIDKNGERERETGDRDKKVQFSHLISGHPWRRHTHLSLLLLLLLLLLLSCVTGCPILKKGRGGHGAPSLTTSDHYIHTHTHTHTHLPAHQPHIVYLLKKKNPHNVLSTREKKFKNFPWIIAVIPQSSKHWRTSKSLQVWPLTLQPQINSENTAHCIVLRKIRAIFFFSPPPHNTCCEFLAWLHRRTALFFCAFCG